LKIRAPSVPFAAAIVLAALLSACGGGSGGASSAPAPAPTPLPTPAPTPAPPPAACELRIDADGVVEAGKTAGATAFACPGAGPLADIAWTQVGGPPVVMLAAHSLTVAFDTSVGGTVRLRAEAHQADGRLVTANADISVAPAPSGSFLSLRADHSVRPGSDTSIRAWPMLVGGETVAGVVWSQIAGPSVKMNTSDQLLLTFAAPPVDADTLLKFRAVMTTSAGRQSQDDVTVSVESVGAPSSTPLFDTTERVHPYRSVGVYAGVLGRCTYDAGIYYQSASNNNFCSAGTLPLLQTEAGPGAIPSVAQIMGRVLVSHDFLGANFEQFLLTQDAQGDFRRLLAGVNAIVIGSHVRPSFYWNATGAIYLDANNFWLAPEQRDIVTEVPDYRSAFGADLLFSDFGRAVKNNAYARRAFPIASRLTRTMDELLLRLGPLLYHELGHAGDFFPPSERNLDPAQSVYANVAGRVGARTLVSDALAAQYPLTSLEMMGIGQVLFQGAASNPMQRTYGAADVGRFFGPDVASDDYAYSIVKGSNSREDLAMLFEEFMMSYRHGVQYDIAFTNFFTTGMTDAQIMVGWGERGRIAEANIKPRIKLVLRRVAPWIDPAVVDTLPAPLMMTPGASWEANLVLGAPGTLSKQSSEQVGADGGRGERLREDLKRPRDKLPPALLAH
jgi:hypothetical protein